MQSKLKKFIYLDHAAATPVDPRVKKAMEPFWSDNFGNPSSLYQKGIEAKKALESARKNIAEIINARPKEIVFTAGGSESVNLAIFGATRMNADNSPAGGTDKHGFGHLITSAIEHPCVLNSFEALKKEGFKTTFIPVDHEGFVNFTALKKAVRPETTLISIMYANNEIGAIQPVAEIGKWIKRINTERIQNGLTRILFHTDACQAAGFLNLNVESLGVDLMSVNGSKIYGPKQTGFLYVKSGVAIKPIIYGGGQEGGLRGGTENVAGAVGLARALELVQKNRLKENERLINLADYFLTTAKKNISGIKLNGPAISKLDNQLFRLPNNINISLPGVEGEALMIYLDSAGICVSTGSACSSPKNDPSHVLLTLGLTPKQAKETIRLTLGRMTTKADIDYTVKTLAGLVKQLRKVRR